jgi:hypothetical protein
MSRLSEHHFVSDPLYLNTALACPRCGQEAWGCLCDDPEEEESLPTYADVAESPSMFRRSN